MKSLKQQILLNIAQNHKIQAEPLANGREIKISHPDYRFVEDKISNLKQIFQAIRYLDQQK